MLNLNIYSMKRTAVLLYWIIIIPVNYLTAQNPPVKSTVVFKTGFEEGNKLIWDDWDGNPDTENQIVSDPGPFNVQGNHAIRLFVPSGQRGGSDLVKVLPAQYDSLHVQWYIKYEKGFNFNAPNHGGGLFAGSRDYLGQSDNRPNGDDFVSATIEYSTSRHSFQVYSYYRGMYQDCANPRGACWGDAFPCTSDDGRTYCTRAEHRPPPTPPVLSTDKWYRVDMKLGLGTPSVDGSVRNGEIALWVDGVNCGKWDNLWMRTTGSLRISILFLSLFHHDNTHSTAGILIDDVTVSTDQEIPTNIADLNSNSESFGIYPNPAENSVRIAVNEHGTYLASVYSMEGKLMISEMINNDEMTVNIERLNKGLYYVIIHDFISNRYVGSGRFIRK